MGKKKGKGQKSNAPSSDGANTPQTSVSQPSVPSAPDQPPTPSPVVTNVPAPMAEKPQPQSIPAQPASMHPRVATQTMHVRQPGPMPQISGQRFPLQNVPRHDMPEQSVRGQNMSAQGAPAQIAPSVWGQPQRLPMHAKPPGLGTQPSKILQQQVPPEQLSSAKYWPAMQQHPSTEMPNPNKQHLGKPLQTLGSAQVQPAVVSHSKPAHETSISGELTVPGQQTQASKSNLQNPRKGKGRGKGKSQQSTTQDVPVVGTGPSPPAQQESSLMHPKGDQPAQTVPQHIRQSTLPVQAAQSKPSVPLVQEKALVPKGHGMELPVRQKRYEGGEIGRKIVVRTNFLPLNLKNICKTAIHYDITFDPDKPKRFLKLVFSEFCKVYFPNRYPAFDGVKNVYASSPLPKVGVNHFQGEVTITNPDNQLQKKYKVTIKFASYVDMTSLSKYMENGTSIETPQEALQCIDIVFRHALSTNFVQIGKSFFSKPKGRVVSLGDGMDLWYGIFSSCVLGWKPYVNVDVAHKGFPLKQLVTEYIQKEKQVDITRPLPQNVIDEIRKFVKTLKIVYQIPGKPSSKRSFRVNDIRNVPAEQETFEDEHKRKTTVVKYYKEVKSYTIQYPKLPCLWVGNRSKNVFIPPELCTIQEGQVVLKKLTETQTRNMIRSAATSTKVREDKIMDAYQNGGIHHHPAVKEFNLTIDSKFEKVDARVLDPPMLEYGSGHVVTPKEGVWRADRSKFLKAVSISHWTVLNLDFRTKNDRIEYFCNEMISHARQLGISINPARAPTTLDSRKLVHALPEYFKRAKQDKIDLVFVIIAQDDSYSKVKQVAELQFGILTQCIKGNTLYKLNPSTCHNILLKVNAKMNGTNYQFSSKIARRPMMLNKPVMIVGADVTHPSPDQTDIPSVVGVAASHDPNAFKYNMIYRFQLPKIEIIEDLHSIMREHLIKFYRETRYKPQAIYFYRDGVSEGQFKQVLNSEFTAIRRACQSLENNYQPPITMLVVQKRHHTRFFPSDQDAVGKNQNVPPGTVVDTFITHPTERDFYLVSHQSIQGVARPTKYKVLWDDNNLSEDQLQELTYFLCHMFSRCTRAVSYPTPTYYAHLAAYRGRIYIEGKKIQLDDLPREQESHKIQDDVQKLKPMFFI